MYLSIQSLAQLHEIYGQHQPITANCPVQVAFAPADLETAELLSRMLGETKAGRPSRHDRTRVVLYRRIRRSPGAPGVPGRG